MEQNQQAQEPQAHPTLVIIQTFLNDCLTENEYFARCSAVLQLIHPSVIVEAARQLQEQAPNQPSDEVAE